MEKTVGVSLRPSSFKNSLTSLMEIFRRAPEADSVKIHSLDMRIWRPVYAVGAVISMEAVHKATGKGTQELSRYVMLDVERLIGECKEVGQIVELTGVIEDKVKMITDPRMRHSIRSEMKDTMLYSPLTAANSSEDRYHLWAWDDNNAKTLAGMLPEKIFPQNILTAFAAFSLTDLGEEVLGGYVKELEDEANYGFSKIRLYSKRLLSLSEELT